MTTPTNETDNWESAPLEAPRQTAGEKIEQQSEAADAAQQPPEADQNLADDAEALAQRQAAADGAAAKGR